MFARLMGGLYHFLWSGNNGENYGWWQWINEA